MVKRSLTNESGTVAFQDGYVICAAALREGAKTVGYFLGGNEQAAMQNILTDEIFEGQSYSCIIDHEGILSCLQRIRALMRKHMPCLKIPIMESL